MTSEAGDSFQASTRAWRRRGQRYADRIISCRRNGRRNGRINFHAHAAVTQQSRTIRRDADEASLHEVKAAAKDFHALARVAGNYIALAGNRAADAVALRAVDGNASAAVSRRQRAAHIGADEVS